MQTEKTSLPTLTSSEKIKSKLTTASPPPVVVLQNLLPHISPVQHLHCGFLTLATTQQATRPHDQMEVKVKTSKGLNHVHNL